MKVPNVKSSSHKGERGIERRKQHTDVRDAQLRDFGGLSHLPFTARGYSSKPMRLVLDISGRIHRLNLTSIIAGRRTFSAETRTDRTSAPRGKDRRSSNSDGRGKIGADMRKGSYPEVEVSQQR